MGHSFDRVLTLRNSDNKRVKEAEKVTEKAHHPAESVQCLDES